MTTKKKYERPTMKVVELKQTRILMTSGLRATRDGYGAANDETWD